MLQFWKKQPLTIRWIALVWFLASEIFVAFIFYTTIAENNIREAKAYVTEFETGTLPGSRWLQTEIDTAVSQAYLMASVLVGSICLVFLVFSVLLTFSLSRLFGSNIQIRHHSPRIYRRLLQPFICLVLLLAIGLGEILLLGFVYGDGGSFNIGETEHYTYIMVGQSINNVRYSRSAADLYVLETYLGTFVEALILTIAFSIFLTIVSWLITRLYGYYLTRRSVVTQI